MKPALATRLVGIVFMMVGIGAYFAARSLDQHHFLNDAPLSSNLLAGHIGLFIPAGIGLIFIGNPGDWIDRRRWNRTRTWSMVWATSEIDAVLSALDGAHVEPAHSNPMSIPQNLAEHGVNGNIALLMQVVARTRYLVDSVLPKLEGHDAELTSGLYDVYDTVGDFLGTPGVSFLMLGIYRWNPFSEQQAAALPAYLSAVSALAESLYAVRAQMNREPHGSPTHRLSRRLVALFHKPGKPSH